MKTVDEFLSYARQYWSAIATVPGAITPGQQWDVAERDANALMRRVPAIYDTVLDFGCGEGRLAKPLASRFKNYIGVDVTPVCIDRCQKLQIPNASYVLLNTLEELPKADVVAAFTVFMHLPAWVLWRVIKHIHSILSDDGMLVFQLNDSDILNGNEEAYVHRYDMLPDAELWEGRRYPHALVRERLYEAGFTVVHAAEFAYDGWAVMKTR